MKKTLFILIFGLALRTFSEAQTPSQFISAFEKSNFEILASYIDDELELCIKDDHQINLKDEAIDRIKEGKYTTQKLRDTFDLTNEQDEFIVKALSNE